MSATLRKINNFIKVKDREKDDPTLFRANHDLLPTPPKEQTWKAYNYVLIWFQSSFNVNEWNTGATIIKTSGLPHNQVIGACVLTCFVTCFFTVINARQGATYKIGYPALARSTYGVYAANFFVFVRMFVAVIWTGVQTYYGAMCLDVSFRCVFGYKWVNIVNRLPSSSATTTRLMTAFFIMWLIQFPLLFLHPSKIRHFFTVKSIIMPIAATGLFVYSICKGHGVGDWDIGPVNLRSSTVGNTWISIINSIVGNISPMIVNQPDVSRYANDRKHVVIPQALGFIPPKICILLFGMISTVCLKRAYGETYWNVWDILNAILDNEWGPAARVLIWFVSISFAIGSIGLNIFANTIPFAADLASLLPEYFTIIRAQVFVGLLAWAVVPWRFLSSAQKFLTFLSSYSMFVGPILGGMLADYYVVRRGNIHVPSLYTKSSSGAYHFYKGCNIWAILCWVACPVIAIPGLIRAYHPNVSTQTATDIYNGSWIYTLLMCFTLHSVCGLYFKPKLYSDGHETSPKTWEYLGEFNGFFEDDVPINGVGYPGTVERDYEDKSSSGDEKGDGDVLVVEVFDSKV